MRNPRNEGGAPSALKMATPPANGNGKTDFLPWIAVLLAAGSAFWSVANPHDDMQRLRSEFAAELSGMRGEFGNELTGKLAVPTYEEFKYRLDRELARLQMEADHLEVRFNGETVPRSEHEQHWREQASRVESVTQQLAKVQNDLYGSYNVGKQLDNLQAQINRIQETMRTLPTADDLHRSVAPLTAVPAK